MKLFFILLLCAVSGLAQPPPLRPITPMLTAGSVTLAWDANAEPDVNGYRLYWGTAAGVHPQFNEITSAIQDVVTGLTAGQTYFFVVTAYNTAGLESLPSNEVSYTVPVPPGPPQNLIILTLEVQASNDLQHWNTFAVVARDPSNPHTEFYRLLISTATTPPAQLAGKRKDGSGSGAAKAKGMKTFHQPPPK